MATAEQLADLKAQIAALEREGLQRQADEGARIHAEKNAPTVSGIYTHLKFPPYVFRPFPKMLYGPDYVAACAAYQGAVAYRERRDEPGLRSSLIAEAQARKDAATRIVQSADEQEHCGSLWAETPAAAVAAQRALEASIALAAAESNFDDRRLGELAQRERNAADDASEGHLVEVAEQRRRPGRPRATENGAV